jgi:hypothetical protein
MKKEEFIFSVDTDNTYYCICGLLAAKKCVLQSCKKCCNATKCTLHREKTILHKLESFNDSCPNLCSLCGLENDKLNFYCKNNHEIISYCVECYNQNKQCINLMIFNNTTKKNRELLKIPISENAEEKKKRIKIINLHKKKKEESQSIKKAEIKKQKKNEKINRELKKKFKSMLKHTNYTGILSSETLSECIDSNLICDDLMTLFLETEFFVKCESCVHLIDIDNVYYCMYCKKYNCDDCTAQECNLCEDDDCTCPLNLCKKSKYKCQNCVNFFVDEFNKQLEETKNEKITSQILTTANLDICDFEEKFCDKIFYCDICKEDVNLSYTKISCCDICKNHFCKKCGVFTCSYDIMTYDEDEDEDEEILFNCNNCMENQKDIKTAKNDIIVIKAKNFKKLEIDTPALNEHEECAVCYINKKSFACVPCGHLCMCYKCKNNVENKCPICNEETTDIIKIYC